MFFISDNGAPLAINKEDLPLTNSDPNWDGSLNDPWVGEKGMLTEGAIRIPFIVRWKNHLPSGLVYNEPVISIDASTTAAALAGINTDSMDGVNLIPYLKNPDRKLKRNLYWRFWNQAAIRKDNWKYLNAGSYGEYLFDLNNPEHENKNYIHDRPDIAVALKGDLLMWSTTLKRPGLPSQHLNGAEQAWYKHYFAK